MGRKKIIAGNWKMNLNAHEARNLFGALKNIKSKEGVDVIVAPAAIYLSEFGQIETKSVILSAQNCSSQDNGAFTGEYSASMLNSVGVSHTIIGHSERREIFKENNSLIAEKVKKAVDNNLTCIFCCGESLEHRNSFMQEKVIYDQLEKGLFHLSASEINNVIIAYEPVWAIGTGKTASTNEIQEMHSFIRKHIAAQYNVEIANNISILYGGSVKPSNAESIFACKDVDGGLIGGAALKFDDFLLLINLISNGL